METFYLGVHEPSWLQRTDYPFFLSLTRLRKRKSAIDARGPWILDSGAFTQLERAGKHELSPESFADRVGQLHRLIPHMVGCVIQDYMCEPHMLARTGMTIPQHLEATVGNFHRSMQHAPALPWIPVLQGWSVDDYLACLDLYRIAGYDLRDFPLVGIGTMCKRQHMTEAALILRQMHRYGIRLHAFGYKSTGLPLARSYITSADSMAWSYDARRSPPLPGHAHKNCATCLPYALRWAERLEAKWIAS